MGVVYDSPEVENLQRFPDGEIFQSFFQALPGVNPYARFPAIA